jgi:3-oxoacyl-[acyl-carrier protein] reductase
MCADSDEGFAKVALVTGASRNLGAAIARRLAAAGYAMAVNYPARENEAEALAVVAEIRRAGGVAQGYRADVSVAAEVEEMQLSIEAELGAPTVLVNNAAVSDASDVAWLEITTEEWDRVLAVNLRGPFLCARAVYPGMIAAGTGAIVNLSSVRVALGWPGNLHYTTSKAGLIGLTRTLAREVGAHGIRVNAIAPGAIRTPDEVVYGDPERLDEELAARQSLKRRGEPDDIGDVVAYLVSDDARFVTGQCLTVDGGWVMA